MHQHYSPFVVFCSHFAAHSIVFAIIITTYCTLSLSPSQLQVFSVQEPGTLRDHRPTEGWKVGGGHMTVTCSTHDGHVMLQVPAEQEVCRRLEAGNIWSGKRRSGVMYVGLRD